MRRPFQRHIMKYVEMVDILDDELRVIDFLRMEKWIFDSPDQCGEAFRQWVKDFYQGNKPIKGELELGGRRVDLHRITMPVLNPHLPGGPHRDVRQWKGTARAAGRPLLLDKGAGMTRWAPHRPPRTLARDDGI